MCLTKKGITSWTFSNKKLFNTPIMSRIIGNKILSPACFWVAFISFGTPTMLEAVLLWYEVTESSAYREAVLYYPHGLRGFGSMLEGSCCAAGLWRPWSGNAVVLFPMAALPVMRFPCLFWQTLRQMSECYGLFLIKANSYACLSWWSTEQWPIYASFFFFLSLHEQKQGPVKCCNIGNDISMQRWFHSACTKFTGTLKSSEAWKS